MKRNLLILLVVVSIYTFVQGQCPNNSMTFTTQAQIDDFGANYPDCTHFLFNITIQESTDGDITNLNGLSNIEIIDGSLKIIGNDFLQHLTGLDNLQSIGGNLEITDNDNNDIPYHGLEDLDGLDNLTTVSGDIIIQDNDNLADLYGLNNLTTVGGDIIIQNNDFLEHLFSSGNLTSIGQDLYLSGDHLIDFTGFESITSISGDLTIYDNNTITGLSGLQNITNVSGDLRISNNDDLVDLYDLDLLVSVGGSLIIESNNSLQHLFSSNNFNSVGDDLRIIENDIIDITGFDNIITVPGTFLFQGNSNIQNLYGFDYLESANTIDIKNTDLHNIFSTTNHLNDLDNLKLSNNNSLTSFVGFESIDTLYSLTFSSNGSITIFDGLPNLEYVDDYIDVTNNDNITNFSGLDNLNYIGGRLTVQGNDILDNFTGLNNLYYIGGDFDVQNNDGLDDFTGLDALDSIKHDFIIKNNNSLTDLSGLNSLVYVHHNFTIEDNSSLTALSGMPSLVSLNFSLIITNNDALTALNGPGNLTHITNSLHISYNDALTSLSGLTDLDYVGELVIHENADLYDLTGLNNLVHIDGNFEIYENPSLFNLNGLDNLTDLHGELYVANNNGMINLVGMSSLIFIGGNLRIIGNGGITNMSGLQNIQNIGVNLGGDLVIYDNDLLANLNGLESLQHIDGYIWIGENDLITSLDGIQNIDPNTIESSDQYHTDLEITYNALLTQCSVQSICDFLDIPGRTKNVHNNNSGCDNVPEIQTNCPTVCPVPYSLWESNVTDSEADLNWTIDGSQSTWDIEWKQGSDFTPGSGQSDGTDVATSIPYHLDGLSASTQVFWYVRTDCGGGDYSDWAGSNFWTTAAAPDNDNLCDATLLTVDETCSGDQYTNVLATVETDEPVGSCYNMPFLNNTVWFKFVAPVSGKVEITTDIPPGQIMDTRISLYGETSSFDCSDLTTLSTELSCSEDVDMSSTLSKMFACLFPGDMYYIQVDGGMLGSGDFCIEVHEKPDFDVVPASATSITSDSSCIDPAGWTHYFNYSNNQILLSIQLDDVADIPNNAVTIDPDGTTDAFWGNNDPDGFPNVSGATGAAFMRRKWNVDPVTEPASDVGVRFYFTHDEFDAVNIIINDYGGVPLSDITQLNFYKVLTNEDPFNVEPGGVAAGDYNLILHGITPDLYNWIDGNYNGEYYAEYKVSSFSGGGGGGASNGAELPIDIKSFNGFFENNHVKLIWQTELEVNIAEFSIEKLDPGENDFAIIGTVHSKNNFNNKYQFIDVNPLSENYYRLKIIDNDGNYTFSTVININKKQGTNTAQIFPNPVKNNLNILLNNLENKDDFLIEIMDSSNKTVLKNKVKYSNNKSITSIDISNLNIGIYFVKITSNNFSIAKKIVKY